MNRVSNKSSLSISSEKAEIRTALIEDIPGMILIMDQNLIDHKLPAISDVLERTGFLIYDFTYEEAKIAVKDKNNFICLVALENCEVVG
jgi:hypothetical protein